MANYLYELCRTKSETIDSLKTDSNTVLQKKDVWQKIVDLFNLKHPDQPLTIPTASEKWRTHKREVKKATAATRQAVMASGNNNTISQTDPEIEKILSVI